MIADMLNNKRLNPVVTELFIRGRKLNTSLVFITQSSFAVSKNIRLNSTHYFFTKVPSNQELQQITLNNSSDIDFKDFMNLYKKSISKSYSTLASDNALPFRKNLVERTKILIMTIGNIRDEKLEYDNNREAAKISPIPSGKIDKYEYLTSEKILSSNQR